MMLFKGAGVAIVTPFDTEENIDYDSLAALIEFQITEGTDAIIICGSTGEPATLTTEEQLDCIRFAVEKTAGRVPVIAGTGSNCTRTAIQLSKEAERLGADGLLVVTPYYNKGTQKGLVRHFTAIAEAVSLPIILYNVPSRTNFNMLPQTIMAIAEKAANVVGVKEASGDISQVAKLARMAAGRLAIYSGNDDQIIPVLSLGGAGVISVLSNIAPKQTHDLVLSYLEGRVQEAMEEQLRVLPLVDTLFCEVNPIPVKAALKNMGMTTSVVRGPLTILEAEHETALRCAMLEYGIKVI